MKKSKLIVISSSLALLLGVSGFKLVNSVQQNGFHSFPKNNLSNAKYEPVQFDETYKNLLNNGGTVHNSWNPFFHSDIDEIFYHDMGANNMLPKKGMSGYENVKTGVATNTPTKFDQFSYINPVSNDVYKINKILIVELLYSEKVQGVTYKKSIAFCIVPIIATDGNYSDLFSVFATTDNVNFGGVNMPKVTDPIWFPILTTTKTNPNHVTSGNSFTFNSLCLTPNTNGYLDVYMSIKLNSLLSNSFWF